MGGLFRPEVQTYTPKGELAGFLSEMVTQQDRPRLPLLFILCLT